MRVSTLLAISLAGLASLPAMAAGPQSNAEATCPDEPVVPAEWQGWKSVTSLKTMSVFRPDRMGQWPPVEAKRTGLALHPINNVKYWVQPEPPIALNSYGGMNTVKVVKAGRLKIALSAGAWIDLVRAGASLRSVAHGHGAACSGIRKIVEFDVQPGIYLLQIANAPNPSISAMALMAN